jgi:hypothetical protein
VSSRLISNCRNGAVSYRGANHDSSRGIDPGPPNRFHEVLRCKRDRIELPDDDGDDSHTQRRSS